MIASRAALLAHLESGASFDEVTLTGIQLGDLLAPASLDSACQ